jgi:hypothetical protein
VLFGKEAKGKLRAMKKTDYAQDEEEKAVRDADSKDEKKESEENDGPTGGKKSAPALAEPIEKAKARYAGGAGAGAVASDGAAKKTGWQALCGYGADQWGMGEVWFRAKHAAREGLREDVERSCAELEKLGKTHPDNVELKALCEKLHARLAELK